MRILLRAGFWALAVSLLAPGGAFASAAESSKVECVRLVSDDAPAPPVRIDPNELNGRLMFGVYLSSWGRSLAVRGVGTKEAPLKVWVRLAPLAFLYVEVIFPEEVETMPTRKITSP